MNRQHTIKAHLRRSTKAHNRNEFVAVVEYEDVIELGTVCELVASENSIDCETEDLKKWTELVLNKTFEKVLTGCSVDLGLFNLRLNIDGFFVGKNSKYDSSKHKITMFFETSNALDKDIGNVSVELVDRSGKHCKIEGVEVIRSCGRKNCIAGEDIILLYGYGVRIAGHEDEIGVYFISEDGSYMKHVDRNSTLNHPDGVLVIVPEDLPWGMYNMKLITKYDVESGTAGVNVYEAEYKSRLENSVAVWGDD